MTRKLFFATTIVGAITFTVSPLWAIDIVTLKSTTKQVQGEIGAINKTEVAVKPRTGDLLDEYRRDTRGQAESRVMGYLWTRIGESEFARVCIAL